MVSFSSESKYQSVNELTEVADVSFKLLKLFLICSLLQKVFGLWHRIVASFCVQNCHVSASISSPAASFSAGSGLMIKLGGVHVNAKCDWSYKLHRYTSMHVN